MIKYEIDTEDLKNKLSARGISIRSLGNKDSINYVGLSDKTIFRALKTGIATKSTCIALADILNYDGFILADIDRLEDELEFLRKENKKLKQENAKLKKELNTFKKLNRKR